ncbi:DUF1631 family protein [Comamonas composti]|uniref:DUF1631 family protein n=1 Tax=Comamonas composti TaxID=408558 RepID=UPI0003FD65E6|nr:DUF1631 family protein [Comamonas composti]
MSLQPPVPPSQPASVQQLGWRLRQRWVHGLCSGLPELARQIDAALSEEPATRGTAREMQARQEAWSRFRQHQNAWLNACVRVLGQALQEGGAASAPRNQGMPKFELLSDEVVEAKLQASRLALAMDEATSSVFDTLRLRIQHLEGRELPAGDLLRVETVCLVFIEQWEVAGLPRADLQRLQDVLIKGLGSLFAAQYKLAHDLLDAQGVQRSYDMAMKVKRSESGQSSANMGFYASASMSLSQTQPGALPGPLPDSLSGVMRGGAQVPLGMAALALARQRTQEVANQLKRIFLTQSRPGMAGATALDSPLMQATALMPHTTISPALTQALYEQQLMAQAFYQTQLHSRSLGASSTADYSSAAVGRLADEARQRSVDWKRKAATTGEKATIEIVALMFQSILSEDRIPPSVRVWFARLQVPVLRVALAEPEFFSDLRHPARVLIDRLGSCVLGFDASSIGGSALETEIKRIVQVIEQYPETGQKVFVLVLREFEEFLARYLTETQDKTKIITLAQQVEQKETLAVQYTIELRNLLTDMPVREEIREFLFKTWTEVLALAAVRHGAQDERTMRLKQAASELVWAASAKPSRHERSQVIQALPALLQTLRHGLETIGITGEVQSARVKQVTDVLAQAFTSKTAAIAPERIEAMAKRLAHLEEFISADGRIEDTPLSPENLEAILGVETSGLTVLAGTQAAVEPAIQEWARSLALGRWFTLDHNNLRAQLQYAWSSRRKQLHLFVAQDGHCYLLQLQRLGAYLQSGLLTAHDEEALTVRATRDALQKIQANPERLEA